VKLKSVRYSPLSANLDCRVVFSSDNIGYWLVQPYLAGGVLTPRVEKNEGGMQKDMFDVWARDKSRGTEL